MTSRSKTPLPASHLSGCGWSRRPLSARQSRTAPEPEAPAAQAWLAGDAAEAARRLEGAVDRVSVLNRGVALVYAGDAGSAESELQRPVDREPAWTPALRWLARARAAASSPTLEETLQSLLADREADSRDFLWIGRLRLDGGEADRARASLREAVAREEDLYLGWLWLGDAEDALGRLVPARDAWLHARSLHAGGDVLIRLGESSLRAGREDEGRRWLEEALATPEGRLARGDPPASPRLIALPAVRDLAPPPRPGERLRYSARYLFFRFATVEIENQGFTELHGHRAARVVFSVRSNPGFPLLTIDSRFESFIAEDGSVLAHRSTSRDSTEARRAAAYDMDPATGRAWSDRSWRVSSASTASRCRRSTRTAFRCCSSRGGSRDRRLASPCSPRSTAPGRGPSCDGPRPRRWAGCERETMQVEAVGQLQGAGGALGPHEHLVSADARALPYKAAIKVALGSVVLDLDPARLPDASRRRMSISEPSTLLTDYVLAAVALAFAGAWPPRRARATARRARWWAAAFALGAVAALAGGIVHGFVAWLPPWWRAALWTTTLMSTALAGTLLSRAQRATRSVASPEA